MQPAANNVTDSSGISTPKLSCNEIWGGNRTIDSAILLPGLRGWLLSQPSAGRRGGDVHYLSVCGSGLLSRLCLADVAGHGESVASLARVMHELLNRYKDSTDQRKMLGRLNLRLMQDDAGLFATAAAVSYYAPGRRVSVSYAGHPPVWWFRTADQRWIRVLPEAPPPGERTINLPLGVDPDTRYTRKNFRISVGDRLLMITDGVLEASNAAGEALGARRVQGLLERYRESSIEEIACTIYRAVDAWSAENRADDVTLLLVECEPGPAVPAFWTAFKNRLRSMVRRGGRGAPPV